MKKVLIFAETYLPLIGGAEIYTYNLAKRLSRLGYNITIFTCTKTDQEEENKEERIFIIRRPWSKWINLFRMIPFAFTVFKIIKGHDIVLANYTYRLSTLTAILSLICSSPHFIVAHGLGTIIDDKGFPLIYKFYRFFSLKLSKGAITTSNELMEIASKYNHDVITATAIDLSWIDQSLNTREVLEIKNRFKGKKIILSVRRLVPKNGIQYMIKIMSHILRYSPNIVYLVVGSGRLSDYLKVFCDKLELRNHVFFEGEMRNEKVFNYMKAADIVVFPSSAEALSLAALETMYIGTPVVATPVGGLRDLIGEKEERGYLLDLFGRDHSSYLAPTVETISEVKYEMLAKKIFNILSKEASSKEKTKLAKEFVLANFAWDRVSIKILDFIKGKI